MKTFYKTIVLSDIHLGIKASKAKEVINFLKHHKCETLILNGDIIDGWQLRKNGKWTKQHSNFFKYIISLSSKKKSKIVYIRGNHDDFLEEIMPLKVTACVIVHLLEDKVETHRVIDYGKVLIPHLTKKFEI